MSKIETVIKFEPNDSAESRLLDVYDFLLSDTDKKNDERIGNDRHETTNLSRK